MLRPGLLILLLSATFAHPGEACRWLRNRRQQCVNPHSHAAPAPRRQEAEICEIRLIQYPNAKGEIETHAVQESNYGKIYFLPQLEYAHAFYDHYVHNAQHASVLDMEFQKRSDTPNLLAAIKRNFPGKALHDVTSQVTMDIEGDAATGEKLTLDPIATKQIDDRLIATYRGMGAAIIAQGIRDAKKQRALLALFRAKKSLPCTDRDGKPAILSQQLPLYSDNKTLEPLAPLNFFAGVTNFDAQEREEIKAMETRFRNYQGTPSEQENNDIRRAFSLAGRELSEETWEGICRFFQTECSTFDRTKFLSQMTEDFIARKWRLDESWNLRDNSSYRGSFLERLSHPSELSRVVRDYLTARIHEGMTIDSSNRPVDEASKRLLFSRLAILFGVNKQTGRILAFDEGTVASWGISGLKDFNPPPTLSSGSSNFHKYRLLQIGSSPEVLSMPHVRDADVNSDPELLLKRRPK